MPPSPSYRFLSGDDAGADGAGAGAALSMDADSFLLDPEPPPLLHAPSESNSANINASINIAFAIFFILCVIFAPLSLFPYAVVNCCQIPAFIHIVA